MKKRIVFVVIAAALLLAGIAQADVKVATGSPRAAKVIAAEAARAAAAPAPTVLTSWTGTRAIIFDAATKTLRKPTASEVAQMVAHLQQMTARRERTPKMLQAERTGGTRQGSIEGEQANVVVARALPDGQYETLCVHTFEEAAEYLGLKRVTPGTGNK